MIHWTANSQGQLCIQGLGFSPNSDKPMSDVGSPGPMAGTIGGTGGASPNPEAMIASSSSVKSKFFSNEFFSIRKSDPKNCIYMNLYIWPVLMQMKPEIAPRLSQTRLNSPKPNSNTPLKNINHPSLT